MGNIFWVSNILQLISTTLAEWKNSKIWKTRRMVNLVEAKTASTNLRLYIRLHILIEIVFTLVILFVLDSPLQLISFRMFGFKHSITFENTHLLSCWFHCIYICSIKFRFCKTFTVINSMIRILWIETLHKFGTITCWFTLYIPTQVCLG